jgi:hypothetical protein
MASSGKTEGACVFCGRRATRGGMSRHLQQCARRAAANRDADETPGDEETLIHLQVHGEPGGDFWMHLEMRGSATLKKLDEYLRAIWLECCGHLSEFTRGVRGGQTVGMARRAHDALSEGTTLTHIYDFGSSSRTTVKVVAARRGRPLDKRPIKLMARNEMPSVSCAECGEPAAWLCLECMYDEQDSVLCEAHANVHPHDEYGDPLPLVNSPRLGVCGYDGPAEPPY